MTSDAPEKWAPLRGMPVSAEDWATPGYVDLEKRWSECRQALKADAARESYLAVWLWETRLPVTFCARRESVFPLRRANAMKSPHAIPGGPSSLELECAAGAGASNRLGTAT